MTDLETRLARLERIVLIMATCIYPGMAANLTEEDMDAVAVHLAADITALKDDLSKEATA